MFSQQTHVIVTVLNNSNYLNPGYQKLNIEFEVKWFNFMIILRIVQLRFKQPVSTTGSAFNRTKRDYFHSMMIKTTRYYSE